MTYTKSSELPKEDGFYWLKYVSTHNLKTYERIIHLEEGVIYILSFLQPSSHGLEDFYRQIELLAWCKIEKPEGGV